MWRGPLLCVLVLAVPAAPARAQVPTGISDQNASALHDPRFRGLGVTTARVIAPWDAALTPSAELDDWLRTARVHGLDALVSFERRRGEDCRTDPCRLPTMDELAEAFEAFRARWPWVSAFGAWNEPNHPSQPTAADPAAAARLYETLAAVCPGCRILAAEPLDTPDMLPWLRRFAAALSEPPALWGLHNYGDVTRDRADTVTDQMLATVGGRLWLTESGGIVRHTGGDGRPRWPYDEQRARASIERTFALADRRADRIDRVFLYQWRAGAFEPWDSGLLRPDGTPRPSFDVVAARLRAAPGPPVTETVPRSPAAAALHVLRRPWLDRRGVVRARVRCPTGAARPCAVRLAVRTKPARRPPRGGRRLLGADRRVLRAGATTALSVRLPALRRRLIRQGRTTALLADISTPQWRQRFVVRCRR